MNKKQEKFTILDGRITITPSMYNPTSDAVWLAAFAPKNVNTILDVGIGTGGISLCLLHHIPDAKITGIDISQDMLDVCQKNADLNNQKITLINGDITKWSTQQCFDLVITNPPYFQGTPVQKHNAHHNADIVLWVKRSVARVKPNGYFCTIVDTLVMSQIIGVLQSSHMGNIQIVPLFSKKNTAERVLIRATKGVRTGTTLFRGMSMNDNNVLRNGLTIDAILGTLGTL